VFPGLLSGPAQDATPALVLEAVEAPTDATTSTPP
jgi:hypothetical protein